MLLKSVSFHLTPPVLPSSPVPVPPEGDIIYKIFEKENESNLRHITPFRDIYGKAIDICTVYQKAQEMMELGDYRTAGDHLARALKDCHRQAMKSGIHTPPGFIKYSRCMQAIQLLAKIYLKQELYHQAAGLLWYAKRFEEHHGLNSKETLNQLNMQIEQIESEFLMKGQDLLTIAMIMGLSRARSDKSKLSRFRVEIKEGLKLIKLSTSRTTTALRDLNLDIARQITQFLADLFDDCVKELEQVGKIVPCQYAFVEWGQLARGEMTPYPNLNISIIVEAQVHIGYFEDLIKLLRLKIVNLGETPLSSLSLQGLYWLNDEIIPSGLNLQESTLLVCKTDTQQDFEFPTIPNNLAYITGSSRGADLLDQYEKSMNQTTTPEKKKERTKKLIRENLRTFTPELKETEGKVHLVETDLYHSINAMFDALAIYYRLESKSLLERIEELKSKVLTPAAALDLKELIMLRQEFRLLIYSTRGRQKIDVVDIEEHEGAILEIYYRAIPFHAAMHEFRECIRQGTDPTVALNKERFFSDIPYIKGLAAYRLMNYREANSALMNLSTECERTAECLELIGSLKHILGQYHEACESYQKAIAICDNQPLLLARLYKKMGDALKKLAQLKDERGGAGWAYSEAKKILSNLLNEKESLLVNLEKQLQSSTEGEGAIPICSSSTEDLIQNSTEEKKEIEKEIATLQEKIEEIYRAQSYLQIYLANFPKALQCLQSAKTLTAYRVRNLERDSQYRVIPDSSLAENKRLEAIITNDYLCDPEKAERLFAEARKILKACFPRSDHPKIANYYFTDAKQAEILSRIQQAFGRRHFRVAKIYNEMGNSSRMAGHYPKALAFNRNGFRLIRRFFEGQHPAIAKNFYIAGVILSESDQCEQRTLRMLGIALNQYQAIFGEKHPHVAKVNCSLGESLSRSGHFEEALKFLEKAQEQYRAIFGKSHPAVVRCYINLGITWSQLGFHRRAWDLHKEALEISQAIFGERSFDLAMIYEIASISLGKLGRHPEELDLLGKALELKREFFEENAPEIVTVQENISISQKMIEAASLFASKDYEQLYSRLFSMRKKAFDLAYGCFIAALLSKKDKLITANILIELIDWTERAPAIDQAKARVILADFFFKQLNAAKYKQGLFAKALEYAYALAKTNPRMLYTFQKMEIAVMNEDPQVEGEKIPFQILGQFYALLAYRSVQTQQKAFPPGFFDRVPQMAQDLLTNLQAGHWIGHKANEISMYALHAIQT